MQDNFWEERWQSHNIGWDLGEVSPPIKAYIDQLEDKDLRILIPGAGNSYEAQYIISKGFKNVFINDISASAIKSFCTRVPSFPKNQIFNRDFFTLNCAPFDLILEQTFFCAILPKRRKDYIQKMSELLVPEGRLVGLLFNREFDQGPPFGGGKRQYESLFKEKFQLDILETAYNSIQPRQGVELFFKFRNTL
jgi:SAM-dependent methyltransferase